METPFPTNSHIKKSQKVVDFLSICLQSSNLGSPKGQLNFKMCGSGDDERKEVKERTD